MWAFGLQLFRAQAAQLVHGVSWLSFVGKSTAASLSLEWDNPGLPVCRWAWLWVVELETITVHFGTQQWLRQSLIDSGKAKRVVLAEKRHLLRW